MKFAVQLFTQGVWATVSEFQTRELAEAEIAIQRSIRINGQPLGRFTIKELKA